MQFIHVQKLYIFAKSRLVFGSARNWLSNLDLFFSIAISRMCILIGIISSFNFI